MVTPVHPVIMTTHVFPSNGGGTLITRDFALLGVQVRDELLFSAIGRRTFGGGYGSELVELRQLLIDRVVTVYDRFHGGEVFHALFDLFVAM